MELSLSTALEWWAVRGEMPSFLKRLFALGAAKSLAPDTALPVDKGRYVVVDTELTGLDANKDSIVSVGAVKMVGGRIAVGNAFYRVVRPDKALTAETVVVHGIMPSETLEQPSIDIVLEEFLRYAEGSVLVGHFLGIDLSFFGREVRRIYGMPLKTPALDTLMLHEWLAQQECGSYGAFCPAPGETEKDLFSLARKYRVPVEGAHNALKDAYMTAQLFQRLLCRLPRFGAATVRDLLRIGKP